MMDFMKLLLRGISVLPGTIQGIESVYGAKSGEEKKAAALEIVSAAIKLTDAVTDKSIVDADGFTRGLGLVVDGVVACLNASIWAQ